jgi:hypothetical protein
MDNTKINIDNKTNDLSTINDTYNSLNKKIHTDKDNFLKKIIIKVKDELAKDEIKNEINNIVNPLYENIYNKIFPHYFSLIILLVIIVLLLLLLITLNIINFSKYI